MNFPENVIFAFLILCCTMLLTLWLLENFKSRREEKQREKNHFFHCARCRRTFHSKEPVKVIRCPKCNTYCINKDRWDI